MHVIGIDAGGTKTVCQLADVDGNLLAEARGAGANLQAAGELAVEKTLHELMEQALTGQPPPAGICVGMAGVDGPGDTTVVQGILQRIGRGAQALIVNDALVALGAGAPDAPGVVNLAGSGLGSCALRPRTVLMWTREAASMAYRLCKPFSYNGLRLFLSSTRNVSVLFKWFN